MGNESKESLTKRYEDGEKELNEISEKLYGKDLSLEELGSLSLLLNKKMANNEDLLYDIIATINSYDKSSNRNIIIRVVLTFISLGICIINIAVGLLLTSFSLASIYKYTGYTEGEELKDLLLQVYAEKSRIASYKRTIINKVKTSSKSINDEIITSEELEMLFDISVRYVEMLLNGADPDIESPYIEIIVKELLKDENHPNASIAELVELRKNKESKGKVLEKHLG